MEKKIKQTIKDWEIQQNIVSIKEQEDFELQSIHDHTLKNDGCKITEVYRNSQSHSVVELKIENRNGGKDSFSLIP